MEMLQPPIVCGSKADITETPDDTVFSFRNFIQVSCIIGATVYHYYLTGKDRLTINRFKTARYKGL